MRSLDDLERAVRDGLETTQKTQGLVEAEVFASETTSWIARLNYTSHIPSNGVEEAKSLTAFGVGIRAVFEGDRGTRLVGFGSETGDLSSQGILRALEKARLNAAADPGFRELSDPPAESPSYPGDPDETVDALSDERFIELAWTIIEGAVDVFTTSAVFNTVIIGGDMALRSERMAVGNTRGLFASDHVTLCSAAITAMVERERSKGTGWACASRLDAFHPREAGSEAARGAVSTRGGERIRSGRYPVIFGPLAVADLFNHLIIPSLKLSAFDEGASPFVGRWGEPIAAPRVRVYDAGNVPGAMGSRRFTCEGIPTGRTELITGGRLVGCLADVYTHQKVFAQPAAPAKLGPRVDPAKIHPRNGFRHGPGGGRRFDRPPGIASTNLFIESAEASSREELLSSVGEGLYIGRLWYTYPINGLAAGDFTATVVGDSYRIRNGTIESPLMPNTVRIDDNFKRVLMNIAGMTGTARPTQVWAGDEVIFAPEIAVSDVRVSEIARGG